MHLYKLLFFNTMIIGTFMAISAYSWLCMWMGLEMNLLSIIPLLSKNKNIYPAESAMKYFITQTMASIILLFAIISSLNLMESIYLNYSYSFMIMLNSTLMIKMGAAPFHFWFPMIMEGLNWMNCLIMLTWQKIAPMVILMYNYNFTAFMSLIIISSSMIGSLMSINQISLRKMMTYSSINHISWMLASMMLSKSLWLVYFFIYSLISINIILIFNSMNMFYIKQMFNSMNSNKMLKFLLTTNFLSLGGLPPFIGFFPKWITINLMIMNNFIILSFIMILFTLIILYMYIRITFNSFIINSMENIKYSSQNLNFSIISFNMISLLSLIFCPLILSLF
uniref:NADH-ubiquinone oxidoreductase chain 2 n=1 Tax=Tritoma metasobrina TaxID=2866208 RepID=A0A8F9WHG0_9CUCU|nr:NADH dehydrogenase subunit 2 [Tritoma metasobrina]